MVIEHILRNNSMMSSGTSLKKAISGSMENGGEVLVGKDGRGAK